MMGGENICLLF